MATKTPKKDRKTAPVKAARGGERAGAGRRGYFKGVRAGGQVGIWLTDKGSTGMARNVVRVNVERPAESIEVSRSAFVEALIRAFGDRLSFRDIQKHADPE